MKKIKSLISILLAICVIFACSVVTSAASASISANASKTNVTAGDSVTVTVVLNSSSGISGIEFTLTYNSSQLEFQSCAVGSAGESFTSMKGVNRSGSAIKGAFLNGMGADTPGTGALATATFKVIATSKATSPLTLTAVATDASANSVPVSVSGTNLQIAAKETTTAKPTLAPTTAKTTVPTTAKPTTTKPTTTEPSTEPESTTTVIISTETIAVKKGNVYQLAKPSAMTGNVTYSSSKTSVATVSDSGVIQTLAKGMTTITAKSDNGYVKTWLLIVGDGSTVELDTTETTTEEETTEETTELEVIGEITEEYTTEELTTGETDVENNDDGDEVFRLIFGTAAVVAVLVVIITIASMIRKRRSFM